MKLTLRILSSILLFVFLLSVIACSSGDSDNNKDKENTSVTTEQKTENPNGIATLYRDLEDSVPALNFEGETIRFLTLVKDEASTSLRYVYDNELWVDELTSDPLSDSIYNRNMYAMERLNCKIVSEQADASDIKQLLEKTHFADEDVYQVVGFTVAGALDLALGGYFRNINALENNYIDFDAPWWSRQFLDEVSANDNIYVLAGSLSLSMTRSIHATFFNKRIAEEQKVENLYDVVNDGRWTIDYQTQLVSDMYRDVNGDDVRDKEDEYGFCSPKYWSTDAYFSAFDIDILSKNDDGEFEFTLNEEKAYDGLSKILALCYGKGSFSDIVGTSDADDLFVSGNAFMITQKLACAEAQIFRNMRDDYGILPMPKYDEKQSEYYSMPFEVFQTYSVPKTNTNPEKATALLEVLCAESWRKVMPIYSEVVLKGKYLSDPQSRTMFDMIVSNTRVDAGLVYVAHTSEIGAFLYRYPVENNKITEFTKNLASKNRIMKMCIKNLNELAFKE